MKKQGLSLFSNIAQMSAAMLLLYALSCVPVVAEQSSSASSATAVQRELDAFARALAGVTKYSARVTIYDQKGSQSQNTVFDYTFSKPSKVTVHVIAGTNKGITLDWNGGPTIVAHGSGLLSIFSKTLSLHDPLVTTLQGASIDQLSFGAILTQAQQAVGRLSLSPDGTIDGVAVNGLNLIPAGSTADAGWTRQVVEMSTVTHLPMRVLGYNGPTLVSSVGFSNVKLIGRE